MDNLIEIYTALKLNDEFLASFVEENKGNTLQTRQRVTSACCIDGLMWWMEKKN